MIKPAQLHADRLRTETQKDGDVAMGERGGIIGYVQLYFRIKGEKDTYYSCFDGDFGKPLSGRRLRSIKRSMKRVYEKFDKVHSVEFCTKEEWDEKQCEQQIVIKWDDTEGGTESC